MIRVAVIGAGHWGPNLIRNFDNKVASEVSWVVDRDPQRLKTVGIRFPGVRLSSDPQEALRDPATDAVAIATPTNTHYPLARAALDAGKHVLVEKPIATDSREGADLCRLAEKIGRVLLVGHLFLYNGGVRRVKWHIDVNDLGRVYYISMVRTNLGPIRGDVNAAWDLAAHDISIASYWLGGEPQSVSAVGGAWINSGVEDAMFATFRYPRDVLVNLHVSWLNPRKSRDITVVGEQKMVTLDDMNLNEPVRIYDKSVIDDRTPIPVVVDTFASFRASIREGDVLIPRVSLGEPLRAECDHFLDCIARGAPPMTGGWQGVAVVRALEALTRSAANRGREEPVAPAGGVGVTAG